MKAIRLVLVMLFALYSVPSYSDEVSTGIGLSNDSIGIDVSEYPEFVVVPGYPVYYAPQLQANLFFYDGDYWIYQNDNWYQSSWYNGPWWQVDPEDVPEFILRIPVRYYLVPPTYFLVWWSEEPPHWGEHWGHDWERHRHGWDKWDHRVRHKPAPLPLYQREYSGDRYPRQEAQHELHYRNYRYQARDPLVQQRHQQQSVQGGPIRQEIIRAPQVRGSTQQGSSQVIQQQERPVVQERRQQPKVEAGQRGQQIQRSEDRESRQQDREPRQQGNDAGRESNRGQGQAQERGRDK